MTAKITEKRRIKRRIARAREVLLEREVIGLAGSLGLELRRRRAFGQPTYLIEDHISDARVSRVHILYKAVSLRSVKQWLMMNHCAAVFAV